MIRSLLYVSYFPLGLCLQRHDLDYLPRGCSSVHCKLICHFGESCPNGRIALEYSAMFQSTAFLAISTVLPTPPPKGISQRSPLD